MFITLEGFDGSGKSSQAKALASWLKERDIPVTLTRNPGGTEIGKRIRELLMDPSVKGLDPRAELLLYLSDRVQHYHEVVRPALDRGDVVICDRWVDSSVVYQGYGSKTLAPEEIVRLHRHTCTYTVPNLTFFLELPSKEEGLRRVQERARWEQADPELLERVFQGYTSWFKDSDGLLHHMPERRNTVSVVPPMSFEKSRGVIAAMVVETAHEIWNRYRNLTESFPG